MVHNPDGIVGAIMNIRIHWQNLSFDPSKSCENSHTSREGSAGEVPIQRLACAIEDDGLAKHPDEIHLETVETHRPSGGWGRAGNVP
jgi:hypothetical protein